MKPFETLDILRGRMAEALIAQSGIRHRGLNEHLRRHLTGTAVENGALLRPAVIEGAFPFRTGTRSYADLAGNLLHERTIEALAGDGSNRESVPRERRPYLHQIAAFEALSPTRPDPRSALVTAGTGSGKTECFLVPMIDDLVRQDAMDGIGEGVQAIMLYPLNALIASQRERLDAWTSPLGGRLRYALYNGLLPDKQSSVEERAELAKAPQNVPNRTLLRASPPPLLVTNLTMLEYMLMRVADAPILKQSRGKLRWIVLDEAHTLIGAAAAEVALLLRRVMEAFAVDPNTVRFVATSATIGEGEKTRDQLQRFLADIGGISQAQVEVIEGHRQLPTQPPSGPSVPCLDGIAGLDPASQFDRLGGDAKVWALVQALEKGAVAERALGEVAMHLGASAEDTAMALTQAKSKAGEVLAPLRVHALHRAVPGLWACTNPGCDGAPPDWPQGRILWERIERCPSCVSPVAEIHSCNECGGVALMADESGGTLIPPGGSVPQDEFRFEAGRDDARHDDEEGGDDTAGLPDAPTVTHCCALDGTPASSCHDRTHALHVDADGRLADVAGPDGYRLDAFHERGAGGCPLCGADAPGPKEGPARAKLFPFRFGTPFVMGNAVPILADAMPRDEELPSRAKPFDPPGKPLGGRQLISFTDSRQGTARLAAKLQGEAERAFVRSYLYQSVQRSMSGLEGDERTQKEKQLADLEPLRSSGVAPVTDLIRTLEAELAGTTDGLSWDAVIADLALRPEADWLLSVWGERAPVFGDNQEPRTQVARMLALREFLRRPRLANSMETLGLARLRVPAIDAVQDGSVPASFIAAGGKPADWRAWLQAIVTFQLRANGAVRVPLEMAAWVMRQARPKTIVREDAGRGEYAWPKARGAGTRPRAVALLELGLGLDAANAAMRHDMSDWLDTAWRQLGPAVSSAQSDTKALEFSKLAIAPITRGYVCPVTHNWLEVAPFGLTPYARTSKDAAEEIEMPRLPVAAGTEERREWLASDDVVAALRERGLWGDIHDRTALFAPYLRSAEHSAQLPADRLRGYEDQFREGRINVLNCSTTMEMGVDIGSVNGVVMTNVPPSIANYRQRVGRAGRRGQPLSLAFTMARDRPLDREAFSDPDAYLARTMSAPKVALDSRPIVQRHVNAMALGRFIKDEQGDALKLRIGSFLGCPADPDVTRPALDERPVAAFREWLNRPTTRGSFVEPLERLVRGSVLQGRTDLLAICADEIEEVTVRFENEWSALREQARTDVVGAAAAVRSQLKRLCDEFMPSALADRGFLPGHGFPNNVVSFELDRAKSDAATRHDGGREVRDDNRGRRQEGPKRPLDVAIREYAPGAELVIDGQVHRSGGVTLNWQRPSSDETVREIQDLRWMTECGTCGEFATGVGERPTQCDACGGETRWASFLRPSGFLRDRHVATHADVDVLRYVPPEDAKVSARGARFEALPLPELGRMRTSRTGNVLFHNRGALGAGYGLCLRCGRMEPMQPGEDVCTALRDHKPLRAREGWSDACPGNEETYAVKHGLHLGHEIVTDVFELQPAARPSPAAAHALAIALREALAQRLGIETGELGYAVKRGVNRLGNTTLTLCLFDKPSGGAGYAIQGATQLRELLVRSREILRCPTNDCERACSACVLASDGPDGLENLDRYAALAFLDDHFTLPDDLADADRFVVDARTSDCPLDDIDSEMERQGEAVLDLWITPVDIAQLDEWALTPALRRWTDHGKHVRIILPPGTVAGLDDAQRLLLRDYRARHAVQLAEGTAPRFGNGSQGFAAVTASGRIMWAARDVSMLSPDATWGEDRLYPIAQGTPPLFVQPTEVADAALAPTPGAIVTELGADLNGPIDAFGQLMAAEIRVAMRALGIGGEDRITEARYEDCYARSPLVLRLLIDTVAKLNKGPKPKLAVLTKPPRQESYSGRLQNDLADDQVLADLGARYGKGRGVAVTIETGDPPHKRSLMLQLSSGIVRVDLDQGFGWLEYCGRDNAFDADADAATRARQLDQARGRVQMRRYESQMVVHCE